MPTSKVRWNQNLLAAIVPKLITAMNEITLRVEGAAKAELYPGHGVRYGTLRRGIMAVPARRQGMRIIGGVGTGAGSVKYAAIIHRKYEYLTKGLKKVIPSVDAIIARNLKG